MYCTCVVGQHLVEGVEHKMNLDSEAVLVLAAHGSGEQLSAGHDEPEHVVEGLEALPDGILPLSFRDHVGAMADARHQTLCEDRDVRCLDR